MNDELMYKLYDRLEELQNEAEDHRSEVERESQSYSYYNGKIIGFILARNEILQVLKENHNVRA